MRLFIALLLSPSVRHSLAGIAQNLRAAAQSGRTTREENFHLTLDFLGETDDPARAIRAMDRACAGGYANIAPFVLHICGIGSFRRDGGDLYFAKVQQNSALAALHKAIHTELLHEGFSLQDRAFRPHLTLGRELKMSPAFDCAAFAQGIPALTQEVRRVSLMQSERIGGVLTYTERYGCDLG